MISDEELKEMVETEGRDYAEPEQLIETMATELLQLRKEKRKADKARAKSWKGAPEWAKYRACDFNGERHYYAFMPKISNHTAEWVFSEVDDDGRYELIKPDYSDWRDTLETRP